jgi:hypothetical protein
VDYLATQVVKLLVQELMLQEYKDCSDMDQVAVTWIELVPRIICN